jgi:signal transduction histidine kinase
VELRWRLHDIGDRKHAEAALRESRENLRDLSTKVEAVRESERSRLARAVHDEIGAALTAIKIDVAQVRQGLEKLGRGRKGGEHLLQLSDDASHLIDSTMDTVRRISMEMRPAILDEFGLVAALDWQLHEFQKRTQLKCIYNVQPGKSQVTPEAATAVFRVFQEILTNVARHAHATSVTVRLHEEDGHLVLSVRDDGQGFDRDRATAAGSLGLLGMNERVRHLGGAADVQSTPGEGTSVKVRIPLGGGRASQPTRE